MTAPDRPATSGRVVVILLLLSVVVAIGVTTALTWPVLQRSSEREALKQEAMRPGPAPAPTARPTPPR